MAEGTPPRQRTQEPQGFCAIQDGSGDHRPAREVPRHPPALPQHAPNIRAWTDNIPFADAVVTKLPWEKTADTPEVRGLPPDIMLLGEIEAQKQAFEQHAADIKASISADMKAQLDSRSVGGSGYAQSQSIIAKVDAMMAKMEAMTSAVELRAATASHPMRPAAADADAVEPSAYKGGLVSDEEDDVVLEVDQPLSKARREALIRERTAKQIKRRTVTVGYHHGRFNILPSSWRYPKGGTVIQLITLWLIGNPKEHVQAFRRIKNCDVVHFDKKAYTISKMRRLMAEVERLGKIDGVWLERGWDSASITTLWSTIWPRLEPYLHTKTMTAAGNISLHKSRMGQITWRTCYNKMQKSGLFKCPGRGSCRMQTT